jgi:hypothetical protein
LTEATVTVELAETDIVPVTFNEPVPPEPVIELPLFITRFPPALIVLLFEVQSNVPVIVRELQEPFAPTLTIFPEEIVRLSPAAGIPAGFHVPAVPNAPDATLTLLVE